MENQKPSVLRSVSLTTKKSTEITINDCVLGSPMINLIRRNKMVELASRIDAELRICTKCLGIDLSDDITQIIVEDLIEKYKGDSFEDVIFCLREGRRGMYGTNYGKMDMTVLSKWMAKHLDVKYQLKESKILENDHIHDFKNRGEYLESIKAGDDIQKGIKKIEQKRKKKIHDDEMEEFDYQNFKENYLKKQSKTEKLEEVEVTGEK